MGGRPDNSLLLGFGGSFLPGTMLAHKGVRGEGGRILVVRGCGGIGGPVLEEHVASLGS